MSADAYTPLFRSCYPTQQWGLFQKWVPKFATINPQCFRGCCFGFGCSPAQGASFPSTSSIPHIISDMEQQTEWYSLPNGCGFLGTSIHHGHVYLFVHGLMLPSRHETHDGVNCCAIFLFHSSTICLTSQNLSL